MKDIIKLKHIKRVLLVIVTGALVFLGACNKTEEIGTPVIKGVRVTNPTKADSLFSRAMPGQLIVITGENFSDLTHVYMNNADVYVNPNFCTNSNIVVTIPDSVPLKGKNPNLPNTIRVVTTHGEALFDFKFLSPAPTFNTFYFNIPAKADSILEIYGSNFYEVKGIYFYRNAQHDSIAATTYVVTDNYGKISVKIPKGANVDGHISVLLENGYISDVFQPSPLPVLNSYSNDIPVPGDTLFLYGKYLASVQKIVFPGNVEVSGSAIKTSKLFDKVAVKVPRLSAIGKFQVVCEAGTVESDASFNDTTKVLFDFDYVTNWQWGANNTIEPAVSPLFSKGNTSHIKGTCPPSYGWFGAQYLPLPKWLSSSVIPDNTPVANLALTFNIYSVVKGMSSGYFEVWLGDSKAKGPYKYYPWTSAGLTGKWQRIQIPLSSFKDVSGTYSTLTSGTDPVVRFFFKNPETVSYPVDVYIDDIRLTYIN